MTDRNTWRTGASACFCGKFDESVLEAYAKADIACTEISFRTPYYAEIQWQNIRQWSQNTGTEVWSIHLPFHGLNIAHPDADKTAETLQFHHDLLGKAGDAGIKVAVVHPSGEPIPDSQRPGLLERCSESLAALCARAKEVGMVIAVEDLPRTCLCNCSEEVLYLLERNPDLRVCFDTNHLLKEANESFVRAIGDKIVTLHVSDYDFIDEKHVFPCDGLVDWKALMGELEKVNYNGPFMYELSPRDRDGRRTLEDVKANHKMLLGL